MNMTCHTYMSIKHILLIHILIHILWIDIYIYVYIYIWVKYNVSLT